MTIGHAQTVTRCHYWLDQDRKHEKTMSVSSTQIDWSMNVADAGEGMHTLYYRVQDSNKEWSIVNSWQFFVKRLVTNTDITVTDLEYWVDASKEHFTTQTVKDGKASFILDASDLTESMHTLYYRFKDNEGQYSFANSWSFFVIRHVVNSEITVTDLEYWVDDNKAHFTTQSVSDGKASFVLDASDLREGMHTLFYRFIDNEKQYSFAHAWQFFVVRHIANDAIQITDLEYWVDSDKEKYKSQTVKDNATAISLNLADMREGLHTLFYRFKDNESGWSYLRTWQFFKVHIPMNAVPQVISCEYWIDNAYEFKHVVTVTEPDVALVFDTEELKKGIYTLYYRFKDNEGNYGPLHVVTFERVNPYDPVMIVPIDATEINAEMKRANPDYMAYPTKLEEQIPDVECDTPEE